MSVETQKVEWDELTLLVEAGPLATTVSWQGSSEVQDPENSVGKFLRGLIPQLSGHKLIMNFLALEYMNSATVQPLLRMLRALNENQIPTEIVYDAAIDWQRVSFRLIKTVSATLSYIRVMEKREVS